MPSTPRKPIEQIGTEIEQINRMLVAIKNDIQEIKEYIKTKNIVPDKTPKGSYGWSQTTDPTEKIGSGWFF